jgi:hypothetical protein
MGELASVAIGALDPFVGAMAASTCVRATAISLGKSSDDLSAADLPALESNIRRLLGPVAPTAVITQIIESIERAAR